MSEIHVMYLHRQNVNRTFSAMVFARLGNTLRLSTVKELFENLGQNLLLKVGIRERPVTEQLRETDDNLSENKGNKTKKGMKWKWRPSTRVSFSLFPILYPKAKQRSERRGKGHNYCVVPSSPWGNSTWLVRRKSCKVW